MENYIGFILFAVFMLFVGFFAGRKMSRLEKQSYEQDFKHARSEVELECAHLRDQLKTMKEHHESEFRQFEQDYRHKIEELKREREEIRHKKDQINISLTRKQTEFKNLEEQLFRQKEESQQFQEKFEKEFENLANKILEQKSEKFTALNKTNLKNILSPLQKTIKGFEEKVEKNRGESIKRHAQLGEQLQQLNRQNLKISEEANNLTKALKGESKTQGNWGEKILGRVLEKSGLQEGREYYSQPSHLNAEGKRVYPDVVVHLPEDKRMIIDSKVSLTAYEKYVNSTGSAAKKRFLKQHIQSLKTHIKTLSEKKYEDLYDMSSPDFVLMFVPLEPALYKAQDADSSFFYTAFQKNILLVSPTTLLATLRTIDALWSNEKQQQNALKIAQHAGSLYHKFQALLKNLETLGNRIESTQKAHTTAMKKLTGQQNLVKDVEKLEKMGISPKIPIEPKWRKKADTENT